MLQHSRLRLAGVLAVSLGAGVLAAQTSPEDALTKKARAIHERVLTLDTHNDISPANFTSVCNYTMDLPTQVNLPKMISGAVTFRSRTTVTVSCRIPIQRSRHPCARP